MAIIYSFDLLTDHKKIPKNGVIYVKIDDNRLEEHTIVLLILTDGIVVEQAVVTPGFLTAQDFMGMTVVELMDWSASSEDDEFENREIDVNNTASNEIILNKEFGTNG
jgi:hypothetical protein